MHILSSGDEYQAVEFGHAFNPDLKILPPVTKKFFKKQLDYSYLEYRAKTKVWAHLEITQRAIGTQE